MKFFIPLMALFLTITAEAKSLTVMQYNVENFFDIQHDEGTDDWTYLPLVTKNTIPGFHEICAKMGNEFYINECLNLDWNEAIFTKKILNISKVIKSFDNTGKGPDIIALEEVENKNVINKLVTKGLDKLGYQSQVLIEGDDTRGIDVALISKYPIISANRYPIIVNGTKLNTRGILEVVLNVDNKKVVVYVNHWPSQSNPTEHRLESARVLAKLADKAQGDLVIAMGDFNTLANEKPAPFALLPNFVDAEPQGRKVVSNLNPGTHFYRGEWSSLDHIFIHKKSTIKADFTKFQIMNRSFMLKRDNRSGEMAPWRFDAKTGEGFADHLPMGLEFTI